MSRGHKKRIAVVVRDRQQEALRMAVGLTLADDIVTVFITEELYEADPAVALNIEMLHELGVRLYSIIKKDGLEYIDSSAFASELTAADLVIPY